ncbi:hypothetical protein [Amycolatopsis sp. FDAARGOS 1241]|uniref:hypothetical protein n=1 Tax=Amycolatopsis sp. FDAARGOS 1241 TaxID=2778070 RepID=UPI00194EBF8B|nr:hypothetical protein [Amycolatopsis sp. FDAARGOS 1241]QRP45613.1 hypothetical protein I6J71_41965 [Amycolatopsis sp. FDAARGOS 1241]
MEEAGQTLQALHDIGSHAGTGSGFNLTGLREHGHFTVSDDSTAWSFVARRLQRPALPEFIGGPHKNLRELLQLGNALAPLRTPLNKYFWKEAA